MTEHIQPTGRTVSLFFRTERVYGMAGNRIISSLSRAGKLISVQLDGILESEGGAAIISPAIAPFDLGALSNDI